MSLTVNDPLIPKVQRVKRKDCCSELTSKQIWEVEKSIKTMSFSEEKPRNCLYRKDKCRLMQRAQGPLLPALLPKWAPPEVQYLCKCPSCFIPVWWAVTRLRPALSALQVVTKEKHAALIGRYRWSVVPFSNRTQSRRRCRAQLASTWLPRELWHSVITFLICTGRSRTCQGPVTLHRGWWS